MADPARIHSESSDAGRRAFVGSATSVVRDSPLPCFMLELPEGILLAVSPGFAALYGSDMRALLGRPVWDLLGEGPSGILDLLDAGSVEGAEVRRTLKRADGSTLPIRISLARVDLDDGDKATLGVVSPVESESQLTARPASGVLQRSLVIGTVDEQWRVDRISCDIDVLLGHPADSCLGQSILTLIHPDDTPPLLLAVAKAVERSAGAGVSLRLATADGGWSACDFQVSPLPEPPRFAFVIAPAQPDGWSEPVQIEQELWDLAFGAQAASVSRRVSSLPDQGSVAGLGRLSTRELEIVTRLIDGKRVPAIASEMFLAQGTVRNHLSAVFGKLGVHSQQGLLDLLRGR